MAEREKTEEELIGTLIKLRKRDSELYNELQKLLDKYKGELFQAMEEKYPDTNVPDRWYLAKMSLSPEKIIELAGKLKRLQTEYKVAHEELRAFENTNSSIVKKYGNVGYSYGY